MNIAIFEDELRLIKDNGQRARVESILTATPDRHAHEPASSTGKYHPAFANGEGGLVRHTKEVVRLAVMLFGVMPKQAYDMDDVVAAAILHDMRKYPNEDSAYTAKDHPRLMAAICRAAGMEAVACLVETHMGQWGDPAPHNTIELTFHLADYLASRKDLYIGAPK